MKQIDVINEEEERANTILTKPDFRKANYKSEEELD
jgi:hypothetical protein